MVIHGVQSAFLTDLQPAPASRPQTIATATLPPPGIRGKWIATKLVLGGIEYPPEDLADEPHFWTFNGDDWRYSFVVDDNRVVVRFKVALTDSEAVYLVDAKLWSGEARGKVVKGICSVDGETLRLCMADKPAIDRPTHFDCPKGSESPSNGAAASRGTPDVYMKRRTTRWIRRRIESKW